MSTYLQQVTWALMSYVLWYIYLVTWALMPYALCLTWCLMHNYGLMALVLYLVFRTLDLDWPSRTIVTHECRSIHDCVALSRVHIIFLIKGVSWIGVFPQSAIKWETNYNWISKPHFCELSFSEMRDNLFSSPTKVVLPRLGKAI